MRAIGIAYHTVGHTKFINLDKVAKLQSTISASFLLQQPLISQLFFKKRLLQYTFIKCSVYDFIIPALVTVVKNTMIPELPHLASPTISR